MQLTTATKNTTSVGTDGFEKQDFSISVTAKAFDTLISQLYTNKIRAVVRELWTNARDSHVEAGIPGIPFDSHLPSPLDPTFRVRDYGVGMDHETVMKLYTTLFESTRDGGNEAVGGFGLGSKSPFAYTDSFTVIARGQGVKRTYLATLGSGIPQIMKLSEEPSDEAQGIEISIPVDVEDFEDFENEAHRLAIGFDPIPQVDGTEITITPPVFVAEDGACAIFAPNVIPGSTNVFVRQGCVIYPVDEWEFRNLVDFVAHNYALVIDVPIGKVQPTPSREALSLDETTRENLREAIALAGASVRAKIEDDVAGMPNILAAQHYWYSEGKLNEGLNFTPKYNGFELDGIIRLAGGSDWEVPVMQIGKKRRNSRPSKVDKWDIRFIHQARIVIERSDEKVVRGATRYKEFAKYHGHAHLWRNPTSRQIERLMTLTGMSGEQFIPLSKLPDPGPPARAGRVASGGTAKARPQGLKGVSRILGKNWERLDEMPADYYWVHIPRIGSKLANAAWAQFIDAIEHDGADEDLPLLALSDAALDEHQPDPDFEIGKVKEAAIRASLPAARVAYYNYCFNRELKDPLKKRFGGDAGWSMSYDQSRLEGRAGKDLIENSAKAAARVINARFPLASNFYSYRLDGDNSLLKHINDYINMVLATEDV